MKKLSCIERSFLVAMHLLYSDRKLFNNEISTCIHKFSIAIRRFCDMILIRMFIKTYGIVLDCNWLFALNSHDMVVLHFLVEGYYISAFLFSYLYHKSCCIYHINPNYSIVRLLGLDHCELEIVFDITWKIFYPYIYCHEKETILPSVVVVVVVVLVGSGTSKIEFCI